MEAPKGRYSVIEKDGRLVVIDNLSGAPASPPPPAQPHRPGAPGVTPQPIVAAGTGMFDSLADRLLTLAVKEWDSEGRAVVGWRWRRNNVEKRWDARLDRAQQRRLGRALLRLAGIPFAILLFMLLPWDWLLLALFLVVPQIVWGAGSLNRLMSETGGDAAAGP